MHSYSCERCCPWASFSLSENESVEYPARTYLSRLGRYTCKGCRFDIFEVFSDIRKRQKTKKSFFDIIEYFDFLILNMPSLDETNNGHFLISKFQNFDMKQF